MKRVVLFLLLSAALSAQSLTRPRLAGVPGAGGGGGGATFTWSSPTQNGDVPGRNGFLSLQWDHVKQRILLYGIVGASATIYSTNMFHYETATSTWTNLGGNGSLSNDCSDTWPTWPPNRHPGEQMAIDTSRNRMLLFHGVCNPEDRSDQYFYSLNVNTASNTWTKITPTTNPLTPNYFPAIAGMVYSPDDDVMFVYGSDSGANNHNNWVYCPNSGALTAGQISAGCVTANDWAEVSVTGGVIPNAVTFHRMVYIGNHKVLLYGGTNLANSIVYNETWIYTINTKTWAQVCTGGCTNPPVYTGPSSPPTFPLVYAAGTGKVLYHQSFNTGSPQDWVYSIVADTWALATSVGTATIRDAIAVWDPVNSVMVVYTSNVAQELVIQHVAVTGL